MFPRQKITDKQKIDEYESIEGWYIANIRSLISTIGTNSLSNNNSSANNIYRRKKNYDLANGIINNSEYQYLTHFLGSNEKLQMPAKLQNMNILKPVIDSLKGSYLQRPLNWEVYAQNEDALDLKMAVTLHAQCQKEVFDLLSSWKQQGLPVDSYMEQYKTEAPKENFKLSIEELGDDLLKWAVVDTDIKNWLFKTFEDLLIVDASIMKIDGGDGHVICRAVNPLNFYTLLSYESDYIHDGQCAIEERFMTINEILDEYGDSMGDDDKERLELIGTGKTTVAGSIYGFDSIDGEAMSSQTVSQNWRRYDKGKYQCFNVEWVSFKEVFIVSTVDKDGRVCEESFEEKQNLQPNQAQDKMWVSCVREGVQIAGDIFCNMQERQVSYRKMDNLNHVELSYTGVVGTKRNSIPMSICDIGEPYQHIYNAIWYMIMTEIAGSSGKVLLMDIAQLPQNVELETFLYYIRAMKIAVVDSSAMMEKTGQPSTFNQFREMDLGLSQNVTSYLQIMAFIRNEFERLIGVTQQEQGQAVPYQTADGIRQMLSQSSAISEPLFYTHNEIAKHTLRKLLCQCQHSFRNGKKAQWVTDLGNLKLLNILPDEISFYDYGVIVEDGSKVNKQLKQTNEIMTAALQAGKASFFDAIKTIRHSSLKKIEEIAKAAFEHAEEQANKQGEMQQQTDKAKMDSDYKMFKEELESKIQIEKMHNDTKMKEMEMEAMYQTKLSDGKLNQQRAQEMAKEKFTEEQSLTQVGQELNKKYSEDKLV